MKSLKSVLSLACGLISAIAVFCVWILLCHYFDRLTHHRFRRLWLDVNVVGGLVTGIIVSGIVKNLIYKEHAHFT